MKLLVGLGNPEPRYETTRHNAGFLVLDLLSDEFGLTWSREMSAFRGELAKGQIWNESCLLLKPMTYMNLSGQSVVRVLNYFKLAVQDLVVFYDDVDVPRGTVRARLGGRSGGHKGVQSIIEHLGSDDFHRIKLGIGKPDSMNQASEEDRPRSREGPQDVSDWVLSQFTDEELKTLEDVMYREACLRLKQFFQQVRASECDE